MQKIDVAREQLLTALDLHLSDKSPVSVHSLAGNAREIIERLCKVMGISSFFEDVKSTFPDYEEKTLRNIIHQYRNAFKHAEPNVDDTEVLVNFSEEQNDSILFMAVHDYGRLTNNMPIEMQVFEAWFLYNNWDFMNDIWKQKNAEILDVFHSIRGKTRKEQKILMQNLIIQYA